MKTQRLVELLENPNVQRAILGSYRGPFSMGVTISEGRPAVRLGVPNGGQFPTQVEIDGETVPVLVDREWQVPEPLSSW